MRADVITGVSACVMLVVGADLSANAETVVVTIEVIGFKFAVREAYAVDMFTGGVSSVGAGLNASGLEVVLTLVTQPVEEIFLSC